MHIYYSMYTYVCDIGTGGGDCGRYIYIYITCMYILHIYIYITVCIHICVTKVLAEGIAGDILQKQSIYVNKSKLTKPNDVGK